MSGGGVAPGAQEHLPHLAHRETRLSEAHSGLRLPAPGFQVLAHNVERLK